MTRLRGIGAHVLAMFWWLAMGRSGVGIYVRLANPTVNPRDNDGNCFGSRRPHPGFQCGATFQPVREMRSSQIKSSERLRPNRSRKQAVVHQFLKRYFSRHNAGLGGEQNPWPEGLELDDGKPRRVFHENKLSRRRIRGKIKTIT